MLLLKSKPLLLQRPKIERKFFTPKNFANRIPEPIRNKVRLIEVSAGRSAISGLFIGTLLLNLKGVSLMDQFESEKPFVIALVSIISLMTILPLKDTGITKKELGMTLGYYRFSMVVMMLLIYMEHGNSFM
jgi:hypothetical protein